MKKALKITSTEYVNMDSIVKWEILEDEIKLDTCNPEVFWHISLHPSGPFILSTPVPIQELKRIARELQEFMGIPQEKK